MGEAAGEDEDASKWKSRNAAIAAVATSKPATTILGRRRCAVRAGSL
jgi:hypothetical protein